MFVLSYIAGGIYSKYCTYSIFYTNIAHSSELKSPTSSCNQWLLYSLSFSIFQWFDFYVKCVWGKHVKTRFYFLSTVFLYFLNIMSKISLVLDLLLYFHIFTYKNVQDFNQIEIEKCRFKVWRHFKIFHLFYYYIDSVKTL